MGSERAFFQLSPCTTGGGTFELSFLWQGVKIWTMFLHTEMLFKGIVSEMLVMSITNRIEHLPTVVA